MKKTILSILAAVTLLLSVALPAQLKANNQSQDQNPKVVVGTYISTIDNKIRIKGQDGNIYVLDVSKINNSIAVSQDYGGTKVEKYVGLADLKEGATVVINLQGVVFVDVKKK